MRRVFLFVVTLLFVCGGSAWLAGCPATATLGIAPITGIAVPISTLLLESNLGCGKGPNEVYKYAVVVAYAEPDGASPNPRECPGSHPSNMTELVPGAVFDCFAAATFGNLPLQDAGEGGLTYTEGGGLPDGARVELWGWVTFYNYDTWNALGGDTIKMHATNNNNCSLGATWETTCTATEEDNILANMSCVNLVQGKFAPPPGAGTEASTTEAGVDGPPPG